MFSEKDFFFLFWTLYPIFSCVTKVSVNHDHIYEIGFFGQRYFLFDFIQRFACSCNYSYLSKSPLKYLDTSHHRKICSFLPSTRYLSFLGFSVLHSLGQFAKSEKFFSRDFFRFDALYFRNRMKGQNLRFSTLQVHRQPFTIFF